MFEFDLVTISVVGAGISVVGVGIGAHLLSEQRGKIAAATVALTLINIDSWSPSTRPSTGVFGEGKLSWLLSKSVRSGLFEAMVGGSPVSIAGAGVSVRGSWQAVGGLAIVRIQI